MRYSPAPSSCTGILPVLGAYEGDGGFFSKVEKNLFPPPTASFPAGKVFSLLEGMLGVGMFGVRMLGEWMIKSGDAWGVRSKDAWDQER